MLGGIAGILKLISNWRKPKSEIAKLDAETALTKADTAVKLSDQLVTLHDKINLMEASIQARQQETVTTIKFYRSQFEYFEKLDQVYRNRSHEVNGEMGRLVLAIRALELLYLKDTNTVLEPFPIKTFDEIVAQFPLPEPPD